MQQPTSNLEKTMTLILGRLTQNCIELGADGLAISLNMGRQPGRTTLQKLFRMRSRPIAIAQVGSNVVKLDGKEESVSDVLHDFMQKNEATNPESTIVEIATALANRLKNNEKPGVSIFWIAGY